TTPATPGARTGSSTPPGWTRETAEPRRTSWVSAGAAESAGRLGSTLRRSIPCAGRHRGWVPPVTDPKRPLPETPRTTPPAARDRASEGLIPSLSGARGPEGRLPWGGRSEAATRTV